MMSDERDPAKKVLDDADALRKAAVQSLPPEIRDQADNLIETMVQSTRDKPLLAIAIAGTIGFFAARIFG